MRALMIVAMAAAGLMSACAATPTDLITAQDDEAAQAGETGFDVWGTGANGYFYNRLSADCDELVRRYGRNASWGHWRMPLALIVEDGSAEAGAGAILTYRCADGSACIKAGSLDDTSERVERHGIPFETLDGARAFAARVANLKAACGLTQ